MLFSPLYTGFLHPYVQAGINHHTQNCKMSLDFLWEHVTHNILKYIYIFLYTGQSNIGIACVRTETHSNRFLKAWNDHSHHHGLGCHDHQMTCLHEHKMTLVAMPTKRPWSPWRHSSTVHYIQQGQGEMRVALTPPFLTSMHHTRSDHYRASLQARRWWRRLSLSSITSQLHRRRNLAPALLALTP